MVTRLVGVEEEEKEEGEEGEEKEEKEEEEEEGENFGEMMAVLQKEA